MVRKLVLMLASVAMASPAAAATIVVEFAGSFAGSFGGGGLVANGTLFSGSFSYDSAASPLAPPTFDAVYALPGVANVMIGDTAYQGALSARVNDGAYEAVRFFISLPNSRNLGLSTVALAPNSVTGFRLPSDPTFFATQFQAGYTDAMFRGNYGNPAVTASVASAAAPEPASWALMIVGFGAIGTAMRRQPVRVSLA